MVTRIAVESVKAPEASSIVRSDLTPEEAAADQTAIITLNLRNLDELKARIAAGDVISPQEMAETYYPTHDDWQTVAIWAQSQGLTVAPPNITHMSVCAHGQVFQVASALQTHFARVHGEDGKEYTAAVTQVSIPSEIASKVSGVRGLQPQRQPRPAATYQPIGTIQFNYGPQYMLDAYGATGVGDGTGQIVAIFGFGAPPSPTDLTSYWAKIGSQHTLGDVTVINPSGYPAFNDDMANGLTPGYEVTMDVEIVTGLCPGAKVRVYCINDYGSAAEAVLADLPANPTMHVLSYSAGDPEAEEPTAADSQYFAALAAQGVTTLAPSGDGGSNPNPAEGYLSYLNTSALTVSYPASDPNVTSVGGTTQVLSYTGPSGSNSGPIRGVLKELAWTLTATPLFSVTDSAGSVTIFNGNNYSMSGGGISSVFTRPTWQTGPGVPAGNMRTIPDVAAAANGGPGGGLYIFDGATDAEAAGTSESSPIWAALCAILNQNLQAKGHQPVGLLGPKLYPLAGTPAMNYISQGYVTWEYSPAGLGLEGFPSSWFVPPGTVDTNGAYPVGPTYDMITGIGTPNIAQIAASLEAPPAGLSVSVVTPLPAGTVVNGSAPITLQATATGSPTSYQWELNGVAIPGATGATQIVYPTAANEGDTQRIIRNDPMGAYGPGLPLLGPTLSNPVILPRG